MILYYYYLSKTLPTLEPTLCLSVTCDKSVCLNTINYTNQLCRVVFHFTHLYVFPFHLVRNNYGLLFKFVVFVPCMQWEKKISFVDIFPPRDHLFTSKTFSSLNQVVFFRLKNIIFSKYMCIILMYFRGQHNFGLKKKQNCLYSTSGARIRKGIPF